MAGFHDDADGAQDIRPEGGEFAGVRVAEAVVGADGDHPDAGPDLQPGVRKMSTSLRHLH